MLAFHENMKIRKLKLKVVERKKEEVKPSVCSGTSVQE